MSNTIDSATKFPSIQVGAVTSPPDLSGGTGAMVTTNKVQGSVHLRTDADSPPEVYHNSAVRPLGFADHSVECRLSVLVANSAVTYTTHMPCNGIITGVRRRYTVVPASTAGTVVAGITVGGNAILASASENEEGLTNDTLAAHALTGTTAYLKVSKGAKVVITVTSNHADMTGGTEGMYHIDFNHN